MLNETGSSSEGAVIVNRKRSDTSAVVVRDENECAVFVERKVARTGAARRHLIQKLERAGLCVDGESANSSAGASIEIANFVDRVEKFPIGVNG